MKRSTWIALVAGVAVVGTGGALALRGGKEEIKWRTAKVDRGSITQRISATGTLNALIQAPVGSQVSGLVTGLFADFNSLVRKDQVIAQIDPTVWETQLRDAQASLERAQAALANAKADYNRNKRLWEQKLLADSDLETKELAYKTAQTSLESAKASLTRAKINLDYCTIKAPVDGVVVARLVDAGQTVAASFSTPSIFSIAKDLSKMKLSAAIDEADIGQVRVGQPAFFTVDSYPDKQFRGTVSEVQLNPVINQNVVTYNVVMEVTNEARNAPASQGEGRPGRGEGHGRPEGAARGEGHGRPEGAARGEGRPWGGHRPEGMGQGRPEGMGQGRPGGMGQGRPEGMGQGRPGGAGAWAGRREAGKGEAAQGKPGQVGQTATLELSTARYIPAGSAVYKGDLALFPGMTANCSIITNRTQDVLRVPSAALRFNPAAFLKDAAPARPNGGQGGGQRQGGQGGSAKGFAARAQDRIWVLENGKPKQINVKAGITDGMFTEVTGEGIREGLEILVGVEDFKKAQGAAQGGSPLGGPGGGMPRR